MRLHGVNRLHVQPSIQLKPRHKHHVLFLRGARHDAGRAHLEHAPVVFVYLLNDSPRVHVIPRDLLQHRFLVRQRAIVQRHYPQVAQRVVGPVLLLLQELTGDVLLENLRSMLTLT